MVRDRSTDRRLTRIIAPSAALAKEGFAGR
jgi:hypothetical protein